MAGLPGQAGDPTWQGGSSRAVESQVVQARSGELGGAAPFNWPVVCVPGGCRQASLVARSALPGAAQATHVPLLHVASVSFVSMQDPDFDVDAVQSQPTPAPQQQQRPQAAAQPAPQPAAAVPPPPRAAPAAAAAAAAGGGGGLDLRRVVLAAAQAAMIVLSVVSVQPFFRYASWRAFHLFCRTAVVACGLQVGCRMHRIGA